MPRTSLAAAGPRRGLLAALAVFALALFVGMPAGRAAIAAMVAGEGSGAPAPASAVLLGTVRDSAGAVVAGAKVVIRNYHGGGGWLDGTTDSEGRYRLEGIEPGEYLVWVKLGDLIETESKVILNGSYDIGFTMDLACKDAGFAVEFGRRFGVPLRLASLMEQTFIEGRARYGGTAWSSMIVKLLEDAVGTPLRAPGFPARLAPDNA